MKSYKQFIVEFDPNRGNKNRATPIIPHYPTAAEKTAASGDSRLRSRNPEEAQRKSVSSPSEQARLAAFKSGKAAGSDSGEPDTPELNASEAEKRAHAAGLPANAKPFQKGNGLSFTPAQRVELNTRNQRVKSRMERGNYSDAYSGDVSHRAREGFKINFMRELGKLPRA